MEDPVQEWVKDYRRGDIDALGRLVEHFRRPLFAYLLRVAGNPADAEELFQETWIKAIRNFDRYNDRKLLSWLFRIGHNLAIDRLRREQRKVDLAPGESGEDPFENRFASDSPTPADAAAALDLGTRIRKAVSLLPDEQRQVFLLRTESDLPFREIAGIQQASINTVLARMQYALAKLRELLKDDYHLLKGGSA